MGSSRGAASHAAACCARRVAFLSDFVEGDYVVHVEHGIAQFKGTVERSVDGAPREYLSLGYAAGDTLYVPTDQVDRIARYTGTGANPSLTRLGGVEWANTKRRVKEDALRFAEELLAAVCGAGGQFTRTVRGRDGVGVGSWRVRSRTKRRMISCRPSTM